jgi:hypothetical protein
LVVAVAQRMQHLKATIARSQSDDNFVKWVGYSWDFTEQFS